MEAARAAAQATSVRSAVADINSRVLRMGDTPFLAGSGGENAVRAVLPPTPTRVSVVDERILSTGRRAIMNQTAIYYGQTGTPRSTFERPQTASLLKPPPAHPLRRPPRRNGWWSGFFV